MCRGNIGNGYAVHSGYMDVAERNNIVILFPQIVATAVNVGACWDWFGYLNTYFRKDFKGETFRGMNTS